MNVNDSQILANVLYELALLHVTLAVDPLHVGVVLDREQRIDQLLRSGFVNVRPPLVFDDQLRIYIFCPRV